MNEPSSNASKLCSFAAPCDPICASYGNISKSVFRTCKMDCFDCYCSHRVRLLQEVLQLGLLHENSYNGGILELKLIFFAYLLQMEEYQDKSLVSSVENFPPASDESRCSCTESSTRPDSETGSDDTKTEVGASSGNTTDSFEENFVQYSSRNSTEVSNPCKSLSESKESVPHQVKQQYLESVSANSSENPTVSVSPVDISSSGVIQEHPSENQYVGNNENSVMTPNTSASGSLSLISDSVLSLQWFGDDTNQLAMPTDQDLRTGGLLQVDVVSISSNILSSSVAEISNREARRNSRRLFWDALSRRSFRRHNNDSPTIVFTTGHADDLGSHDRWLLDLSGDLHYDGIGRESEYFGSRRNRRNERRRQLRSEVISLSSFFLSGLPKCSCRVTRNPI